MLAVSHSQPFDSEEYLFEMKWDGYRALCQLQAGETRIISRGGSTLSYPSLSQLHRSFPPDTLLDGEIVAFVAGRPNFQSLARKEGQVVLVVFDLLLEGGRDLRREPLIRRRERLHQLAPRLSSLFFSPGVRGAGKELYALAERDNWEGIMAKELASPYRSGQRSRSWLKIKVPKTGRFWLIGFSSEGRDLRSVHLAEGSEANLRYRGRVGTGWTQAQGKEILSLLNACPEVSPPHGVPAKGRFCPPIWSAMIEYREITEGGALRHPVYRGGLEEESHGDHPGRRNLAPQPSGERTLARGDQG